MTSYAPHRGGGMSLAHSGLMIPETDEVVFSEDPIPAAVGMQDSTPVRPSNRARSEAVVASLAHAGSKASPTASASPAKVDGGGEVDTAAVEKPMSRRERMKSKLMITLGLGKTGTSPQSSVSDAPSKLLGDRKEVDLDKLTAHLKGKLERRRQSRELLSYLVFLVFYVLWSVWVLRLDVCSGYEGLLRSFVTDVDFLPPTMLETIDEFWEFTRVVTEKLYDDQLQWHEQNQSFTLSSPVRPITISQYNNVVGMWLVQTRVPSVECEYEEREKKYFGAVYENCSYQFYADEIETPFGPVEDPTRYNFTKGAGYIARLTPPFDTHVFGDDASPLSILEQLEGDHWLDTTTKSVELVILTFNGNLDLIARASLTFFFDPSGAIQMGFPGAETASSPLFPIVPNSVWDVIVYILTAILFVAFVIYFLRKLREFINIAFFDKKAYELFNSFYRWTDIMMVIMVICISWLFANVIRITAEGNIASVIANASTSDAEVLSAFSQYTSAFSDFGTFASANVLFFFLRAFKYFTFNKRLGVLNATIANAMPDILNFLVMFGIAYIGFGIMGHIIFGRHGLPEFGTYPNTLHTLFRMMIGEFDFRVLLAVGHYFPGIVFFFGYAILCHFILLNLFLAIIVDAYATAWKQAQNSNPVTHAMKKGIMRVARKYRGKLQDAFGGKKKKSAQLQPKEKAGDHIGSVILAKKFAKKWRSAAHKANKDLALEVDENGRGGDSDSDAKAEAKRQRAMSISTILQRIETFSGGEEKGTIASAEALRGVLGEDAAKFVDQFATDASDGNEDESEVDQLYKETEELLAQLGGGEARQE
eukprot:CAMPEP_0113899568 /NCGR_PEP_ID=MMETSP0780_2-20120614/20114_1 /TAXON_ID=652834 /ORGANISM="Palpitomonas bilix" /LENGTH=818 /DNA_ID=CAMNT_0000891771 /DNA_START=123 /DNA_END=2579 /DNA_ORIENTATION=+ /assembly_acc=CAM_ASM_000599